MVTSKIRHYKISIVSTIDADTPEQLLGKLLRHYRREAQLSQGAIAEKLCMSASNVQRIESTGNVDFATVCRWAEAVGIEDLNLLRV